VQATLRGDHERFADLAHPKVIELTGGRANLLRGLRANAADMAVKGFAFVSVATGEPSGPVESGGAIYGTVPYTLHLTGPGGATCATESFLIGESTDGGARWVFLDGNGVRGDRAELLKLLPRFPDALVLQPYREPVWLR
jgi:hypothetical protein